MAILLVFTWVIAWDTDWRKVDRKRAEYFISDYAQFIVASIVLPFILRCFLSTLAGVLASVKCLIVTIFRILRDSRSRYAADKNPYPNGLAVTPCGCTVIHILRDSQSRHVAARLR